MDARTTCRQSKPRRCSDATMTPPCGTARRYAAVLGQETVIRTAFGDFPRGHRAWRLQCLSLGSGRARVINHDSESCCSGRTTAAPLRSSRTRNGLRYEVDPPDTPMPTIYLFVRVHARTSRRAASRSRFPRTDRCGTSRRGAATCRWRSDFRKVELYDCLAGHVSGLQPDVSQRPCQPGNGARAHSDHGL